MKNRLFNISKESFVYKLIYILIFSYVLLRAIAVDITYDEAWTLKSFVPLPVMNIINYTPCDANNHILNTLLIKLFYSIGPESVFVGRLPNVLAFIIYLFYSFRISRFLYGFAAFAVFILLIINPFALDFFSLARGYGLGLAFQAMSVYYLLAYIQNKNLKFANYALAASALGVFSNFSQLNYWAACQLTLALVAFFHHRENKLKFIASQFLISVCMLLLIYEPIRKLIKSNSLYYGGNSGFYPDTLVSLAKYTHYSAEANSFTHIALITFLLITVSGICFLLIKNVKKDAPLIIENTFLILLLSAIACSILQHYILGTLYLIDRTALFYYPLFILVVCFAYNRMQQVVKNIVLSVVVLFFSCNFIFHANSYKTALWYFDSHTTEILDWMNKKGVEQNKNVTIDFSWPFQSGIRYYKRRGLYPNVTVVQDTTRGTINLSADYYIYLSRSLEKVGYTAEEQTILQRKKETVASYPAEGIYIFGNIK